MSSSEKGLFLENGVFSIYVNIMDHPANEYRETVQI